MGLHFTKVTKYGVDANYWNIAHVNVNKEDGATEVLLNGFISKNVRLNGGVPITDQSLTSRLFDFGPGDVTQNTGGLWTAVYTVLTAGTLPVEPVYQLNPETGTPILDANGLPIVDGVATAAQEPHPFCEFYGAPEE